MAVLSDRDIRAAIVDGRVRIDPYDESCLQPSSVDLHLDREFRVFRNNRYPYIDVRHGAARPDRAGRGRGRGSLHPPSRRVRARPDARVGRAARRPGLPARGKGAGPRYAGSDAHRLADDGRPTGRRLRLRRDWHANSGRSPPRCRCSVGPAERWSFLTGSGVVADASHLWATVEQGRPTRWSFAGRGPHYRRRSRSPFGSGASSTTTSRWPSLSSTRRVWTSPSSHIRSARGSGDGTTTKAELTCVDHDILAQVSGDGYAVRPVGYAPTPLSHRRYWARTRDQASGRYIAQRVPLEPAPWPRPDGRQVRPTRVPRKPHRSTDGSPPGPDGHRRLRRRRRRAMRVHEHEPATRRRRRRARSEPGFRPVMSTGRAMLEGVDHGPKYRVKFTPDRPVFRVPRKLARQKPADARFHRSRAIDLVREVPSVPVRCIEVASPRGHVPGVPVIHPDAQQLPRPPRAAHPLDGGLRRPGLEGQPDAGAVERGQPAHRALLRHEDRPDQLLQHELTGRAALRLARSWARSTRASRRPPPPPSTGTSSAIDAPSRAVRTMPTTRSPPGSRPGWRRVDA